MRSILLDTQVQIARPAPPLRRRPTRSALPTSSAPPRAGARTCGRCPGCAPHGGAAVQGRALSIELPLPCSYDLEVIANRYFGGLSGRRGAARVPVQRHRASTAAAPARSRSRGSRGRRRPTFELPVSLWQQTLERHFSGSAWIRVSQETFDRRLEAERGPPPARPTWRGARRADRGGTVSAQIRSRDRRRRSL